MTGYYDYDHEEGLVEVTIQGDAARRFIATRAYPQDVARYQRLLAEGAHIRICREPEPGPSFFERKWRWFLRVFWGVE